MEVKTRKKVDLPKLLRRLDQQHDALAMAVESNDVSAIEQLHADVLATARLIDNAHESKSLS